jgi:hypothetical protein
MIATMAVAGDDKWSGRRHRGADERFRFLGDRGGRPMIMGVRSLCRALAVQTWPLAAAEAAASDASARSEPTSPGSQPAETMYSADNRFRYVVNGREYTTMGAADPGFNHDVLPAHRRRAVARAGERHSSCWDSLLFFWGVPALTRDFNEAMG